MGWFINSLSFGVCVCVCCCSQTVCSVFSWDQLFSVRFSRVWIHVCVCVCVCVCGGGWCVFRGEGIQEHTVRYFRFSNFRWGVVCSGWVACVGFLLVRCDWSPGRPAVADDRCKCGHLGFEYISF